MKKYLIITAIVCVLLFIGLSAIFAQVKETRNVAGFSKIEISSGIDLYIEQGNQVSMQAEARSQEILDNMITEVQDNTLKIYQKKNLHKLGHMAVYITVKDIEAIKASGGSDVRSDNGWKVDKLEIKASGGSDIFMKIEADEFICKISGGSDASLSGNVGKFQVEASGGSDIRAKDLIADISDLTISGGSDATVTANKEIIANANGGSDLTYYGDATISNINASGGSDVRRR